MIPDDLERILRATLSERAEQGPDAEDLTRRVLADIDSTRDVRSAGAARSRRRHLGRLLVPLASAASVAAVVALGLVITRSDGPKQADSAAGGGAMAASAAGADVEGKATIPSGAATAPAVGTDSGATPSTETESARPVPTTFQITDLSFDSPQSGFALGTVACASGRCPALARSTDPSAWTLVSDGLPFAVDTDAASSPSSGSISAGTVRHIRFATATTGYAYGPGVLFLTTDGGVTWADQKAGADALEVADDSTVRVTSSGCSPECTFSVSRAVVSDARFSPVTLPGSPLSGSGVQLARAGEDVFVATSTATGTGEVLLSSTDGGQTWKRGASELCGGETGNSTPAQVTSLAAAEGGSVAVLCSAGSLQYTVVSADRGATFSVGRPITGALATAVALAGPDSIVVGGASLRRSVDAGLTWRSVSGPPALDSTRFLGFQDASYGRWVGGPGTSVWTTRNGGAAFTAYAFS